MSAPLVLTTESTTRPSNAILCVRIRLHKLLMPALSQQWNRLLRMYRCDEITGRNQNNDYSTCGRRISSRGINLKIAGGQPSVPNSWPMLVGIFWSNSTSFRPECSGTLIDSHWVITSANCLSIIMKVPVQGTPLQLNGRKLVVHVGEHHLVLNNILEDSIEVEKIVFHPNYRPVARNPIALLKLKTIALHNAACVPNAQINFSAGTICKMIGWGQNRHNASELSHVNLEIHETNLPVLNQLQCMVAFNSLIPNDIFCAGETGKGPCNGDGGTPLLCPKSINGEQRWFLAGIYINRNNALCNNATSFFSRINSHKNWISQTLRIN